MAKTLDEKIKEVQTQISALAGEKAELEARIISEQSQYDIEAAAGNWTAAHAHSDWIQKTALPRSSAIANILPSLVDMLKLFKEQKEIQVAAQAAIVAQEKANAANTLTAQQQFDLEKAQIKAEQTKAPEETAAKTQKYWIIGGVIVLIAAIAGVVYFKKK